MTRHNLYSILLMAALCGTAFVGCRKDDFVDISKYKTIITVQSTQSKTHYNPNDGSVHWDAGDEISVARGTTFAAEPFTLIDTANGVARFGGDLSGVSSGSYFAIYPAQENLSISNTGVLTCEVVKTHQTLTESTFGRGNNTSVGFNDATTMQFRNVGALAKIAVRGNAVIKSIKIIDNDHQSLSGHGNIDVMNNLGISFDAYNSVDSVVAHAPTAAGISLNAPKWFYIVLPPCTLRNYTLVLTDINGYNHCVEYTDTSVVVERSKVVMLGAFEVDDAVRVFSVGNGVKVKFAHGNLHCNASGSPHTWWFAKHQYTTNYTTDGCSYNAADVEHFYWGPDDSTNPFGEGGRWYTHIEGMTCFDWGTIGGIEGENWRTLSNAEWNTVLQTRTTLVRFNGVASTVNNSRFVQARIDTTGTGVYVNGLILFPDRAFIDTTQPEGINEGSGDYSANTYNVEQWTRLFEAKGCVFLPAAGQHYSTTNYFKCGKEGNYWTSTSDGSNFAYYTSFTSNGCSQIYGYKSSGKSVRLVQNQY